eukprot:705482-Rhodomonas_salina.1
MQRTQRRVRSHDSVPGVGGPGLPRHVPGPRRGCRRGTWLAAARFARRETDVQDLRLTWRASIAGCGVWLLDLRDRGGHHAVGFDDLHHLLPRHRVHRHPSGLHSLGACLDQAVLPECARGLPRVQGVIVLPSLQVSFRRTRTLKSL